MLSQNFIEEMKTLLLQKKQRLEQDLRNLSAHVELGDDVDANAEEIEIDEVNQDLIATMKSDLEKINKALDKITNNTYGTDEEGKEISQDRLRVIPWADKAL